MWLRLVTKTVVVKTLYTHNKQIYLKHFFFLKNSVKGLFIERLIINVYLGDMFTV